MPIPGYLPGDKRLLTIPSHAPRHGLGGGDPVSLDASQINTGRFIMARMPTSSTANKALIVRTANGDPVYDALTQDDIPSLDPSKIPNLYRNYDAYIVKEGTTYYAYGRKYESLTSGSSFATVIQTVINGGARSIFIKNVAGTDYELTSKITSSLDPFIVESDGATIRATASMDSIIDLTGTSQRVIIKGLVLNCNSVSKSAIRNLTNGGNGLTHTFRICDIHIKENLGYAIDIENPMIGVVSNIQTESPTAKGGLLRVQQTSSTINFGEVLFDMIELKSDLSSTDIEAGILLRATAGRLNFLRFQRVSLDCYNNPTSKPVILIDGAVNQNSFDDMAGHCGDDGKPWLKIINGAEDNHFSNCTFIDTSNKIILGADTKNNMFTDCRFMNSILEDNSNGLNVVDEWGWSMQPFPDGKIPFSLNQKILTRGEVTQNYNTTTIYSLSDVPYYPYLAVEIAAYVSANTLDGATTLTLRKDGADTSKALSISAASTGFFKERNVVVDYNRWGLNQNRIDLKIATAGTSGSITLIPTVVIIPRKTLNI
jgi:hypothetical protein